MTKTIIVKNNSNNIKVWAKITDRAGNTSEEEIRFSIDKTVPTIEVTYDNNDYDIDFINEAEYYKDNRTAVIVVTERNFNPEDVVYNIVNSYGSVPNLRDGQQLLTM